MYNPINFIIMMFVVTLMNLCSVAYRVFKAEESKPVESDLDRKLRTWAGLISLVSLAVIAGWAAMLLMNHSMNH